MIHISVIHMKNQLFIPIATIFPEKIRLQVTESIECDQIART